MGIKLQEQKRGDSFYFVYSLFLKIIPLNKDMLFSSSKEQCCKQICVENPGSKVTFSFKDNVTSQIFIVIMEFLFYMKHISKFIDLFSKFN